MRGGLGVGSLRRLYGGSIRRGPRPSKFQEASGAILRHVVQQLEAIGVVEKCPGGYVSFLDICSQATEDAESHKKDKEILTELPAVLLRLPTALKLATK